MVLDFCSWSGVPGVDQLAPAEKLNPRLGDQRCSVVMEISDISRPPGYTAWSEVSLLTRVNQLLMLVGGPG